VQDVFNPAMQKQLLSDMHVGGGGGVEESRGIFKRFPGFEVTAF